MKIFKKAVRPTVTFGELKIGLLFMYKDKVYKKFEEFQYTDVMFSAHANAIPLDSVPDDDFQFIHDDEIVEAFDAVLVEGYEEKS